jgi:hypothetical protein
MPLQSWILLPFLLLACKPTLSPAPQACPPCECKCTGGAGSSAAAADLSELLYAASKKMNKGDGKGCLADLDRAVALAPQRAEMLLQQRATCTMLAGRCDEGKTLARKALQDTMLERWGPEQIDRTIDAYVGMYCSGGRMGDRDRMLHALAELQTGAYMTSKTVAFCEEHHRVVDGLRGKVKPKNDEDTQIIHAERLLYATVPQCYARAGDCGRAWGTFRVLAVRMSPESYRSLDPKLKDEILRSQFDALVERCKAR